MLGGGVLPGRAKAQRPGLRAEPEASKFEQQGGEPSLVSAQGKLDQTAQEINSIFQHHGRLVGQ